MATTTIYTTLTAGFTQPAVNANVTVAVVDSSDFDVDEGVYIAVGGYYIVRAIPNAQSLVLYQPGYIQNAAPTTAVSSGTLVIRMPNVLPVPSDDASWRVGATGATGASGGGGGGGVGATGATGIAGSVGQTGATGIAGSVGQTGATGIAGSVGQTGATGIAGVDGSVGQTGATGVAGSVGQTGATGIGTVGQTGATGIAGSVGQTGATGVAGSVGQTGATGVAGSVGQTGATGVAGSVGQTGATGVAGSVGQTGATGVAGTVGQTGATGVAGSVGATGATGIGTVGATGATGASSATSYRGYYDSGTSYLANDVVLYKGINYITSAAIVGVAPDGSGLFLDDFTGYADNTSLTGTGPSAYPSITYITGIGSFGTSAKKTTISATATAGAVGGTNQGNGFNPGVLAVNADFTMYNGGGATIYYFSFETSSGAIESHTGGFSSNTSAMTVSGTAIPISTGDIIRLVRSTSTLLYQRAAAASPTVFTTYITGTLVGATSWSNNRIYFGSTTALPSGIGTRRIAVQSTSATNTWTVLVPYPGYPVVNPASAIDCTSGLPVAAQTLTGRSGIITLSNYALRAATIDAGTLIISDVNVASGSIVFVGVTSVSPPTTPIHAWVSSVTTGSFSIQLVNLSTSADLSSSTLKLAYLILN